MTSPSSSENTVSASRPPLILLQPKLPPMGCGIASFVLGMIGLVLFPLPILGGPLSGVALLLGIVGAGYGLYCGAASDLRWSLAGISLSLLALTVNAAINAAPSEPARHDERRQLVPTRPYVPASRRIGWIVNPQALEGNAGSRLSTEWVNPFGSVERVLFD